MTTRDSLLLSVIVFFFLSSLASVVPQDQDSINKPRELICTDSGDCIHKISRALKGSQNPDTTQSSDYKITAKDTVKETKESVDDVTKQSTVDPAEAVKSASKIANTLRGDVLRNMTIAAMHVEKVVLRKVGRFLKVMLGSYIETVLNAAWLLLDLKFVSGFIGLLGFSVAYGISVWVVFISPYVLSRTLPRWQVPAVERVVRDVYGWILVFCVFTAWIGHFTGRGISGSFDGQSLFYSLFIILVNMFALERRATQVLLEKINLENQRLEKGKMVPESYVSSGDRNSPIDPNSVETVSPEAEQAAERTEVPGEPSAERISDDSSGEQSAAVSGDQSAEASSDDIGRELARLNVTLQNLNWWSTFFNNLTLVSLTWYLITLSEHVYVYTRGISYEDSHKPHYTSE